MGDKKKKNNKIKSLPTSYSVSRTGNFFALASESLIGLVRGEANLIRRSCSTSDHRDKRNTKTQYQLRFHYDSRFFT
jgi:hypothetical protein